jgi:hypothetical protein
MAVRNFRVERKCGEVLFVGMTPVAVCLEPYDTEHSHADGLEAIRSRRFIDGEECTEDQYNAIFAVNP